MRTLPRAHYALHFSVGTSCWLTSRAATGPTTCAALFPMRCIPDSAVGSKARAVADTARCGGLSSFVSGARLSVVLFSLAFPRAALRVVVAARRTVALMAPRPQIARPLCSALAYIHSRGIIHRVRLRAWCCLGLPEAVKQKVPTEEEDEEAGTKPPARC